MADKRCPYYELRFDDLMVGALKIIMMGRIVANCKIQEIVMMEA